MLALRETMQMGGARGALLGNPGICHTLCEPHDTATCRTQASVKIAYEVLRPHEMPLYALIPQLQGQCNAHKLPRGETVAPDYMAAAQFAVQVMLLGKEALTCHERVALLERHLSSAPLV